MCVTDPERGGGVGFIPRPEKELVGLCGPLPETLISDQNLRFSQPYFRPDQKVDTLFQLLHGWRNNLRRALLTVLSPNNDEEVSSKKHTQFKT